MFIWIAWRGFTFNRVVFAALLLISPMIGRLLWRATKSVHPLQLLRFWSARKYRTYRSSEEENWYWATAEIHGRRLRSSDARFAGSKAIHSAGVPVVTSYSPALLPYYRQEKIKASTPPQYHLSLRALCKWHRMVFPGPRHPTVSQAFRLRKGFSSEDLREIHRISRMVPDERVFGSTPARWKPKYREIWRKWLQRDEREIHILFQ